MNYNDIIQLHKIVGRDILDVILDYQKQLQTWDKMDEVLREFMGSFVRIENFLNGHISYIRSAWGLNGYERYSRMFFCDYCGNYNFYYEYINRSYKRIIVHKCVEGNQICNCFV